MTSQLEVSINEAVDRRAAGAVWIDVRESDEWKAAHIDQTTHIPLGVAVEEIERRWPDHDTPLNISCLSGGRSMKATMALRSRGYRDVVNVAGGINAWIASGRHVVNEIGMTEAQADRYSRHVRIPEVGVDGQRRLLDARVLLLGAGGLGSPAALYLAAAGVGTLGLLDDDVVERSNLQRQILHQETSIGESKVRSAERTLKALNPDVQIESFEFRMDSHNAWDVIDHGGGWDVIIDGTDNLPTRYLVNDAAVMRGIPVVHGSIYRFEGQLTVFDPHHGPCYRCLYPSPPPPELAPSCVDGGVLGVLPGIIGSLQAVEAIKVILGIGDPLVGRLMMYDALGATVDVLKLPRDASCPACGDGDRIHELIDYDEFCAVRG